MDAITTAKAAEQNNKIEIKPNCMVLLAYLNGVLWITIEIPSRLSLTALNVG